MGWRPSLGAWRDRDTTRFRVWAPEVKTLEVVREPDGRSWLLAKSSEGFFEGALTGVPAGGLYRYRLDGNGPFPDPVSRYQPQGVHGPSQVVDPSAFPWTDQAWRGFGRERLVLYEMHLGTFTPEGTLVSAAAKLAVLRELGVTAVELMPLADFPGRWNWGYDGVSLFAPARCYGTPDDLRRFVNEAHRAGLAVHLDVVYNHFGPDGAYHGLFSPYYFSKQHRSPWGSAFNFDGEQSAPVRQFVIENALYWMHEYHLDGFRLDATHAIIDDSPRHILAELADTVHREAAELHRRVLVIAEDHGNLNYMVKPESRQGYGLDGVWSDDFHHQMRVCLAGDRDGYFADFEGTTGDIAATVRDGWFYSGQYAPYFGGNRGTDPREIEPSHVVIGLQNHDQIGNRAFGDRLNHKVDLAACRAAAVVLLLAPETPLIFMGQEWAASTPFQFFTDHNPELGAMVTEGRRQEFARFQAFADPANRERIPDPQSSKTFEASRLRWEERNQEPHASMLRLYRALLALRPPEASVAAEALDANTIALRRDHLAAVVRLRGSGETDASRILPGGRQAWAVQLHTEESAFAPDARPPSVEGSNLRFARPGAVVFRRER
jgi:maltooligosyltrehalose trehalohydrolase